jgi:hypothetical protein
MKTPFQIWLLTSLMCLLCLSKLAAQSEVSNHFDVSAGLSTTDNLNVGVRYNFGQNSVALNAGGYLAISGSWLVSSSFSYYRHLWGHSKHTLVFPWYIKAAVHFYYSESELTPGNFSDTRQAGVRFYVGRDFNITSRLNFSTAVGPVVIFFGEWYGDQRLKPHVLPGMDISIFYRL